ncbi:hypothetical protein [Dickeya ananatis]|uniref:hypothetical protein n=1 Tax=Dickeya ananatis TaxID=3061286 RepID=UPI00388D412F
MKIVAEIQTQTAVSGKCKALSSKEDHALWLLSIFYSPYLNYYFIMSDDKAD